MKTNSKLIYWILGLLLVFAFIVNLSSGPTWINPLDLLHSTTNLRGETLLSIRLPRALAAVLVGSELAVAGQLLQTIARNPIADPSILGINSGANLALIVGGILGVPFTVGLRFSLALIGALISCAIVLGLSMSHNGIQPLRLILGGSIFPGFLVSVSYAVSLLTQSIDQYRVLLVGGFSGVTYSSVILLSAILLVSGCLIYARRDVLTLFSMDDQLVQGLGARRNTTRLLIAIVIAVIAGGCVAVAGNIAFIGLGVPQCVALISGHQFKQTVGQVFLCGGIFLSLGDALAKSVRPPFELPLGALTATMGGIFLLVFLQSKRGERIA